MQLSERHIEAFKDLYEKKYGEILDSHEALEIATRVLRLVEIVTMKEIDSKLN